MRNFPNVYTSYGPGMPVINGTPGSFVATLKKLLVTGTDPVSISKITVVSGVATITVVVEDQVFLNGSRIGIMGCDEPQLNGIFEIDYHDRLDMKFLTTVADGIYTGASLKINQPPAGWNLLFTETNITVFTSGNLDSSGVCIKVIDNKSLYITIEFYENMTEINSGINKFNSLLWGASRVVRVYKSFNATTIPINYWLVADNTTIHFSIERINSVSYTAHSFNEFRGGKVFSMGEMEAVESFNKKHFYFTGDYSLSTDTTSSDITTSFMIGNSLNHSYIVDYNSINSCVFTPNSGNNTWQRMVVYSSDFLIGGRRVSGSSSKIASNIKLSPFYYLNEFYSFIDSGDNFTNLNIFGKIKETINLNQQVTSVIKNGTKVKINTKNYICLPIYYPESNTNGNEINVYEQTGLGMLPFLINEKWGD